MKTLYKATIFYFMGSILTRFSGFILLPLYTNILTTAEYGNYALLMAVYAILNVFYQAGLFQGFTKFFYNQETDSRRVFSTTLNTIILFGFLISLLLSILIRPITGLFSIDYTLSSYLLILFWLIFFDTIAYFGLHYLRTRQMAKPAVYYTIITALANLLLNSLFLIVLKLNILGILLAQGLSNVLLFTLCLRHYRGFYERVIDWLLLRKLLFFSFPLVIAGAFGILMDVADRFIIAIFMDRGQVGIYGVAYKLGLLMNVFVIAFRTAYLPYFLDLSKVGNHTQELKLTLIKLISLMSILYLGVVFFLKYLFQIEIHGYHLINPDYQLALHIVPFILLAYVFNGLSAFFSLAPYISGKSYHFVIADLIGFLTNIALNFLLIPVYGIMGAALATLLGFYTATLYMYFVFNYQVKETMFGKEIFGIVIGCLISIYASSIIDHILVRVFLILLFILFCLKMSKMSIKSFFRLTVK